MRTRTLFRFSLVGATILAATTSAEAARRFSLAGNALIDDADDVYVFPQLTTDNARMIGFDYGAASNSGTGVLILGDKYQAWGVAIHRGDAMTPWMTSADGDLGNLNGYGSGIGAAVQVPSLKTAFGAQTVPTDGTGVPTDGTGAPADGGAGAGAGAGAGGGGGLTAAPKTVVDFLYASTEPGKTGWGLRLTLGSDKDWNQPKGGKENFTSEHFVAATFGYTDKTGRLEYDGSGTLLYDMGTLVGGGKELATSSRVELSLNARGTMPIDGEKDTKLGLLGQARYGTSTIDMKSAGKDVSDDLHLMVGAGPVIKPHDRITVAAYGIVGVVRQTQDPNSKQNGNTEGRVAFMFPGVNLATEVKLKDWLFFRTGAEYDYLIYQTDIGTSSTGGAATSQRFENFVWNAGLGFKVGDLDIDGALSHKFITEGPDFIGGDSPLFAMVSAKAKF